jgi:hypothetical protein
MAQYNKFLCGIKDGDLRGAADFNPEYQPLNYSAYIWLTQKNDINFDLKNLSLNMILNKNGCIHLVDKANF